MVQLLQPAGLWNQLGSLCFLLSGMFGDLLLIRICLFAAYTWLLTAACTGYPSWPDVTATGSISVDGIVWAILNLIVHGAAMGQLLWDERRIAFREPEEEQLWRLFYRRSGMGRLELKQSIKYARRQAFHKGSVIMRPEAARTQLMLLAQGLASYSFSDAEGNVIKGPLTLLSGQSFDIGILNILGVYLAFEPHPHSRATVTAATDCVVWFWDLEDLDRLAARCSPAVSAFWRSFALCQVGLEWFMRASPGPDTLPVNGRGRPEPAGILQGTARSSDFTDPLEPYEEDPRPSLGGLVAWLASTLAPLLPPGMRHTAMPRAGALARNRIIALGKDSQSRMLQREPRSMRRRTRLVLESLASEGLASAKYTPAAAAAAAEGGQEKLGAGKPSEAAEV